MSSEPAIAIRGLGKAYQLRHADDEPKATLMEAGLARLRRPMAARTRETFWALQDVSFDVARGEILGLIGPNGAGKSTLLKILARITQPSAGQVDVFGRLGSLLEVGTGFHPELTGRENIYLNGSILGMRRREIERRFDEIVDFAGVERFLDTPVKRYSSGMYVRLAFAVAAHLDSEILLVDEVLAVGDASFQRKSVGKMGEAAEQGRTVIVVSHNLGLVTELADRCVLLANGRVEAIGSPRSVVEAYSATSSPADGATDFTTARRPDPHVTREVSLLGGDVRNPGRLVAHGESLQLELRIKVDRSRPGLRLTFTVYALDGHPVGTTFATTSTVAAGEYVVSLSFSDLPLAPGRYFLAVGVADSDSPVAPRYLDVVTDVLHFECGPSRSGDDLELWPAGWGDSRFPYVANVTLSVIS